MSESVALPRTTLAPGLSISRVLTGLWQVADLERGGQTLDAEAAAAAIERYVDAGLTTLDMADHYGSAEAIAGHFRATRPERGVECLTKWVPEPGPISRAEAEAAVERACTRLQTDAVELLQYHCWRYDDPAWLDGLLHLDALRREGRVGHLGLTNVDTDHLALVLDTGVPVVSNQICFSLLDRRARERMLPLCRERGVKVLAFGTLAGGLLTERWLHRPAPAPDELSTWSQMKYARFVQVAGGWERFQRLLHAVQEVSRRHDVSMANVATRWVLDHAGVAGIIVGARLGRREHIGDTLRMLRLSLDDDDRARLAAATEELDAIPGDCGDEYRRPPFLTASGDLSHHLDGFPPPYPVAKGSDGRRRAYSGTVWEERAGFSRAVRHGRRIVVSGTTATHRDRVVGGTSAASQMTFALDKVEGAIRSLGGDRKDIVRTRIYVRNVEDWEPVSAVHGRRLGDVAPANTLVRAELVGEDHLVEVEAEAVVAGG
jgi:aryl-alcohol dehydrogenase-like predicted oxidoreductase/enamine deaminase RidA (YjgF/YER057c/UK114 family)